MILEYRRNIVRKYFLLFNKVIFMPELNKKSENQMSLEPVFQIWGWVLLIWSLYRYFFKLPEIVDEFIFKPLVFLGPVLWYVFRKEKRNFVSLGVTDKNIFNSIYIGIGFGMIFAVEGLIVNFVKNGEFNVFPIEALKQYGMLSLLVISFVTAFSEEILNRGFLFNRIFEKSKNLPYSVVISSILFILLHVPILVTQLKFQGTILILFFITNFILGMVNATVFSMTSSIMAPVLIHVFWNMTVALYL